MEYLIVLIQLLLVSGKVWSQNNTTILDNEGSFKVIEASNWFGLWLYLHLAQVESSFVICPISLSSVLGMVFVGSRGDTASELNKTLGYEEASLDETELLESFKKTVDVLNESQSEYQLNMANSIWLEETFELDKNYEKVVKDAFHAELRRINFASFNASVQINEWVNDNTNGKIPQLFNYDLDSRLSMLLLNAVYFKGSWHTKFDPKQTYRGAFINEDKSFLSEVSMMTVRNSFRYYSSEELKAELVELPYSGHDVSMIIILPHEGISLLHFENYLNPLDLFTSIARMTEHHVLLEVPKFKVEKTLDLNGPLRKMGAESLFSHGDFSGISRTAGLTVSEVVQKVEVEVNEEGSEAAAVSSMIFSKKKSAGERIMVVNRPFMFIIGHISSGSMLFIGRVKHV